MLPVGENEAGEDPLSGPLSEIPEELQELLPEEIKAALAAKEEEQLRKIANLNIALMKKRKTAVAYRSNLGIEQEWADAEDAYEGIDDSNRATARNATATKPRNADGGSYTSKKNKSNRSTVFLNITGPYTDAAAARVADMLLPTDDRNFTLKPTPLTDSDTDPSKVTPEQLQMAGANSIEQLIAMHEADVKKRTAVAEKRIDDWLSECQAHAEIRKAIEDCARLGTGLLKGPVPTKRKRRKIDVDPTGAIVLSMFDEIVPQTVRVDPWDVFPDPSCGENIANGSYIFERARLSARQLRDLIGQPGYLEDEIRKTLEEGPNKTNEIADHRDHKDDERYDVWYFNGQISSDEMDALDQRATKSKAALSTSAPEDANKAKHGGDFVNVVCTLVNDRVIKAAPSHLDSGEFPYDMMPWRHRQGMPYGQGVPKQIDVPQRGLNASVRQLCDNNGLSAIPMIVRRNGVVTPNDGVDEIRAGKIWNMDADSDVKSARDAFMLVDITSHQNEIMATIQFFQKMAEDVTGLPMMMQGSQGSAPDTVGGMQILNTNANTVLRRLARLFDDNFTTPHIRRYYEWLMQYGDEAEKGDYQIEARGSTSLVERDIQARTIQSLAQMVINPVFGASPKKWFVENLKAGKVDPDTIVMDQDEIAQQQAEQQQQQQAAQQQQDQAMQAQQQQAQQSAEARQADMNTKMQIHNDTITQEKERLAHEKDVAAADVVLKSAAAKRGQKAA